MIIPLSKENNLIYLFITHTPDGEIKVFVVVKSRVLKSKGNSYKSRCLGIDELD